MIDRRPQRAATRPTGDGRECATSEASPTPPGRRRALLGPLSLSLSLAHSGGPARVAGQGEQQRQQRQQRQHQQQQQQQAVEGWSARVAQPGGAVQLSLLRRAKPRRPTLKSRSSGSMSLERPAGGSLWAPRCCSCRPNGEPACWARSGPANR